MGGSRDQTINSPANLLGLCRTDHSMIEASRPFSEKNGWLISRLSHISPDEVPVLRLGVWTLLQDDGTTKYV
jgi:hypothetical protein